jgi:hypothetical protein
VLAGQKQKQITLPVTITDAGQPIFDVVTVSGYGLTRQAVVRVPAPKPANPWPYVLGGAALLAAGGGGAAWWRGRNSPQAQRNRWLPRIAAKGALGAAQEASVGAVQFAAPPISVRAHMEPGETRFGGPIPVTPESGSEPPHDPTPGGGPAGRTS